MPTAPSLAFARIIAGEPSRLRKARRIRPTAIVAALALAASIALAVGLGAARNAGHDDRVAMSAAPAASAISFTVADKAGATGSFISAAQQTPLHFSDGSELALAPAARVRVIAVESNGARVLVENGSLHVSVVHREQTRWAIEAGPYVVHVTGTKFVVAWDAAKNGLVVKMEEGSVVVDGCGLGQRLGGTEELVVSCSDKTTSTSRASVSRPFGRARAVRDTDRRAARRSPELRQGPRRRVVAKRIARRSDRRRGGARLRRDVRRALGPGAALARRLRALRPPL